MLLKIKRVDLDVPPPFRATHDAAGLDFALPARVKIGAKRPTLVGLGWAVEIPSGHVGLLTLRSSLGLRGLMIPHGVGIIDADYRGELKILLQSINDAVILDKYTRVCQLIIQPFTRATTFEVDELTDTNRAGGFGSTGE